MMKRWIIILLVLTMMLIGVANAEPSIGDLIRFIPVSISVSGNDMIVDGYFLNLNSGCEVCSFRNFYMYACVDGQVLTEGDFGTINEFTVKPMSVYRQSFTFGGGNRLNDGKYYCDDSFYCVFSADFSYRTK